MPWNYWEKKKKSSIQIRMTVCNIFWEIGILYKRIKACEILQAPFTLCPLSMVVIRPVCKYPHFPLLPQESFISSFFEMRWVLWLTLDQKKKKKKWMKWHVTFPGGTIRATSPSRLGCERSVSLTRIQSLQLLSDSSEQHAPSAGLLWAWCTWLRNQFFVVEARFSGGCCSIT